MKKNVLILLALVGLSLNSFGQINSSSVPVQPLTLRTNALNRPKLPASLQNKNVSSVVPSSALSTKTLSQEPNPAETAVFRRIDQEEWLKPGNLRAVRNYGAELNDIFHSETDPMDETSTRGPVDVLFPTGR